MARLEVDVPSHTTSQTPSERSRSDKREVRAPLPPGAVMPQSGASRFSHRGYDYHASREGMPAGSHHVQSNKLEVHHHEMTEVNNTMNLQQVQNNEVYVNSHDPAITQMVEQVAEARHREAMANTESMMQSMVSEMSGRFHAEEQAASARMQQMMLLAESRENQFREELAQQGEVYKRVLDGNARQSNATKDQQIQSLRDHYERQDEHRRMQMSQLESIIKQQSEQIRAQQLQTESMNMRMSKLLDTIGPLPVPVVQTATAIIPPSTEVKYSAPLPSFASASAPKPTVPNQDIWEMLDMEAMPRWTIMTPSQRSQVLGPLRIHQQVLRNRMQEGNHQDLILQMTTKVRMRTMTAGVVRTSVGRSTLRGADAHREVGLGTEMMMMETGTGTILMIVTTVSSVA